MKIIQFQFQYKDFIELRWIFDKNDQESANHEQSRRVNIQRIDM